MPETHDRGQGGQIRLSVAIEIRGHGGDRDRVVESGNRLRRLKCAVAVSAQQITAGVVSLRLLSLASSFVSSRQEDDVQIAVDIEIGTAEF